MFKQFRGAALSSFVIHQEDNTHGANRPIKQFEHEENCLHSASHARNCSVQHAKAIQSWPQGVRRDSANNRGQGCTIKQIWGGDESWLRCIAVWQTEALEKCLRVDDNACTRDGPSEVFAVKLHGGTSLRRRHWTLNTARPARISQANHNVAYCISGI